MATKKAHWLTCIYEESAPLVDVVQKLTVMGAMALISPLHDRDLVDAATQDNGVTIVDENGEEHTYKKPHRHVILIWEGPTTYQNAKILVDTIGGVGCIPAITLRGSARYHCHLDNPEKALYSPADEIVIGGMDYNEIISSASDDDLIFNEMTDFIDDHNVISYRQFHRYCRQFRPDWAHLINVKFRENVFRYLRSCEREFEKYGRKLPDLDENGNGETGFLSLVDDKR